MRIYIGMAIFYFIMLFNFAFAKTLTEKFQFKIIKSIHVVSKHGRIKVIGHDDVKSTVHVTKMQWGKHCTLKVYEENLGLNIIVEQKESIFLFANSHCQVDFLINADKNVNISIMNGLGDLRLSRVHSKDVRISSGSGNIQIEHSEIKQASMKVGSGNIQIEHSEIKRTSMKVGSGNITIDEGKVYFMDISVGSGDIEITSPTEPIAGSLNIKSGSGEITLKKIPENSQIKARGIVIERFYRKNKKFNSNYNIIIKSGSGNLKI